MPPLCLAALVVVSFSTPVDLRPAIPAPGLVIDPWPVTDTSEPLTPLDAGPRLVPPPGDWQLLLARAGVRRRKTPMPWPETSTAAIPWRAPPRPHPARRVLAIATRAAQWVAIGVAGATCGFMAMGLMVSSADREAAAVEAFRRYALHLDHVAARRAAGAADIVWVGLDVNGYLGTESNN